jgi:hypothetical protein
MSVLTLFGTPARKVGRPSMTVSWLVIRICGRLPRPARGAAIIAEFGRTGPRALGVLRSPSTLVCPNSADTALSRVLEMVTEGNGHIV